MAARAEGLELRVRVPLPAGVARVALGSLSPDLRPLPHPGGRPHPHPRLRCCGDALEAHWEASGARGLRGGVSSFLELLGLVLETIERFGGGEGEGRGQDPSPTPRDPSPTPNPPPK